MIDNFKDSIRHGGENNLKVFLENEPVNDRCDNEETNQDYAFIMDDDDEDESMN